MRLCARQSGITLDILHVERRAADHSANIGSRGGAKAIEEAGIELVVDPEENPDGILVRGAGPRSLIVLRGAAV
jgi:hypothetical protein